MSEILNKENLKSELKAFVILNLLKFNTNKFKVSYDMTYDSMMITVIKGDEDE